MALLGGLIHNFTIPETRRLQKFTVYKVHMISFPRNTNLFSTLTKLTIWKRYSDFKQLESSLSKIYKHYNLKSFFKSDNLYFKRFDPDVVEQRKKNVLEFLYYCAENPVIYRSQCFVKFFEAGNTSPTEETIEAVEDEHEQDKDGMSSSMDEASVDLTSLNNSIELEDEQEMENSNCATIDDNSFDHLSTGFDYLYDAAMCFSQAVQEEANLRYKPAFELYKVGIDKLLTGAKSDNNEKRKRIAKTKAGKYLERAEMLYENHIVQLQEETLVFEDQASVDEIPSVLALERPVNNLSRFKVLGISDYMMRVQDCTDKKFYILKNVYKDTNCTILLPQAIPFMVRLISYYKTDNSIFLLLPLVSGGLLWDYINSYSNKPQTTNKSLEEIFVDPPDRIEEQQPNCDTVEVRDIPDDCEVEIAEEIFATENHCDTVDGYNDAVTIPSFDTLSSEMDINDLMSCSQMLLQSVSKTLEKSQIQVKDKSAKTVVESVVIEESLKKTQDVPEPIVVSTDQQTEVINTEIINKPTEVTQIPETVLKQWSCELIVAVHNLHKAGIICGDLNLDNLLLGPSGHLTLTYFYQSDRNQYQQLCRLNPKAMKCLYVAFDFPLTQDSDWYSVGVIIYELLTSDRFFLNHPTGVSRFNEVQYSNPDDLSEDAKDVLHGLIIEKGEKRFKYEDLVSHQFFKGINFDEVEKSGLEIRN